MSKEVKVFYDENRKISKVVSCVLMPMQNRATSDRYASGRRVVEKDVWSFVITQYVLCERVMSVL